MFWNHEALQENMHFFAEYVSLQIEWYLSDAGFYKALAIAL